MNLVRDARLSERAVKPGSDRTVVGAGARIPRIPSSRALLFYLATSEPLERAVKRLPGGEVAAWRSASRYVAGCTRSEAVAAAGELLEAGHGASVDFFGEREEDPARAETVRADYEALAAALPTGAWLSLDLSRLALGTVPAGATRRLRAITEALPNGARVQVGAEEAALTDAVLSCLEVVAAAGPADRLGGTLQANLHRSARDAERLAAAGLHVRLVKGAYVEPRGAHAFGEPTDVAFVRLAHRLAELGADVSLATHDGRLREALLLALGPRTVEHLLGVRRDVLDELRDRGIPTRVYVPYGPDWFRYWLRRVAEARGTS